MPWNETIKIIYTRPRALSESDLTDEEWALAEPCLPPSSKIGTPARPTFAECSTQSVVCSKPDVSGGRFLLVFLYPRLLSIVFFSDAAESSPG